jgi:hypothetical protein
MWKKIGVNLVMKMRFRVLAVAFSVLCSFSSAQADILDTGADAVKPPSTEYLVELEKQFGKAFVLERYDAKGNLVVREQEPYISFKFISPTKREINGKKMVLRGLTDCPLPKIEQSNLQIVDCEPNAREFAEQQYDLKEPLAGRVVLCKTFVLDKAWSDALPVSCSVLIGEGRESMVSYDDENMLGTRVVAIARKADGTLLRPDMAETEKIAATMYYDPSQAQPE